MSPVWISNAIWRTHTGRHEIDETPVLVPFQETPVFEDAAPKEDCGITPLSQRRARAVGQHFNSLIDIGTKQPDASLRYHDTDLCQSDHFLLLQAVVTGVSTYNIILLFSSTAALILQLPRTCCVTHLKQTS